MKHCILISIISIKHSFQSHLITPYKLKVHVHDLTLQYIPHLHLMCVNFVIIIIIYLQSIDPIYSHKDKNRMWIWSTACELISYIIYILSNKYKQFVKTDMIYTTQ
jgi:hypothetical protein